MNPQNAATPKEVDFAVRPVHKLSAMDTRRTFLRSLLSAVVAIPIVAKLLPKREPRLIATLFDRRFENLKINLDYVERDREFRRQMACGPKYSDAELVAQAEARGWKQYPPERAGVGPYWMHNDSDSIVFAPAGFSQAIFSS